MIKLVHNRHGISCFLEENKVNELVIEHPALLTEIVTELGGQCEGREGGFVLSQDNKLLAVEKSMAFMKDPFSVDGNSRRILTKLYQELEGSVKSELHETQAVFYQSYLNFMDHICEKSGFYLHYNEDPDVQEIFKMAGLKNAFCTETLLERVAEYIKISSQLLGRKIFVFLNLKLFLNRREIEMLYQDCFYRKVHLVLIEAVYREKYPEETVCIIDKDKCFIYP